MRKFLLAALAASCLIAGGCGGDSSTGPRRFATLAGNWAGTVGPITIHMDVGADTLCSQSYGYCQVFGSGTYSLAGGISGSFDFSGDYFMDGKVIALNIGGFGTDANILFGGQFDSQTQISGTISETSTVLSPLNVGVQGIPITLTRQ